jgi:GMP synthase-like glutamine amidotransferase
MKISLIQHVAFEGPGRILPWCLEKGHDLQRILLYNGEAPPSPQDYDMLIVMGGPMSANDEPLYPWLKTEKRAIAEAITGGKKVLGICLGAQLLAHVLGSRVYANAHKEIGWYPIQWTRAGRASRLFSAESDRLQVFHWHGETFDLPAGCEHLAFSEACQQQAFSYDQRVVGLQFHIEMGAEEVQAMIEHGRHELVAAPYIDTEKELAGHSAWYRDIYCQIRHLLNHMESL